jgi:hypothetical protein
VEVGGEAKPFSTCSMCLTEAALVVVCAMSKL